MCAKKDQKCILFFFVIKNAQNKIKKKSFQIIFFDLGFKKKKKKDEYWPHRYIFKCHSKKKNVFLFEKMFFYFFFRSSTLVTANYFYK